MYIQFDIDILSLLLLIIVLIYNLKNGNEGMFRQLFFRALIFCNMGILLIDILIYVLLNQPGSAAHVLLMVLQSLFFTLCAVFCLLYALYSTVRPARRPRRFLLLLTAPLLVLIVALCVNAATGFIFKITADNGYQRGPVFHIISVCTYLYIAYALIKVWRLKKSLSRSEFYTYLVAPFFPVVTGAVQLALSLPVLIVWPVTALSMTIIQMSMLTEKINLDHLTGLYNRKYLDEYVESMLQASRTGPPRGGKKFAAIMLDIDNFKKINDTYGHVEGDRAIVLAADLLRRSIRKGDFVSRYGGDEFLIVLEQCSDTTPTRVIRRIRESATKFNHDNSLPYAINFSVGYKVYSSLRGLTSQQIFTGIDELMYQNKHSKVKSS